MTGAAQRWVQMTRGLPFKSLLAIGAAVLPVLAIAGILGTTLITAVRDAEADFDGAISVSRGLTEIKVLVERERGLVARIPAELELPRIDRYARDIAVIDQQLDAEVATLAASGRIVSPDVVQEIRAVRAEARQVTAKIVDASKSFAQSTALELVNGPFEVNSGILGALLAAIESNVDGVVSRAREHLDASSQWAWRLTPVALIGALLAVLFGSWMIRRHVVAPIMSLTDRVTHIHERGSLETGPDDGILQRADEIGKLSRAFNLMVAKLAVARQQLIDSSEAKIRTQYERLDAAISNMAQGLCMYDAEQKLIICNQRYAEFYEIAPEHTVPGTPLRTILEHRLRSDGQTGQVEDVIAARLEAVSSSKAWYAVNELRNGRIIAVSHRQLPNGGSIATHEDITERRQAEAKIAFLAHHDPLTSLPNRVSFRSAMDEALKRVARGGAVAVLCLDLDHFKAVNDTLGHPVGDALLQAVADRIRACVRPTDTIARLGGDEFAIVQTDSDQPVGSTALATRVIEELSAPYVILGHQVVIGASVGISVAPQDTTDADLLLKHADMALYRAKEDGRGVYRFFEAAMDAKMQHRRALELDLRKALALGEFELFYQPSVDVEANRLLGLEALIRWRHPERGLVPPGEFVPLLEEIGLITQVGAWALKDACRQAMEWPDGVKVAVNLSPVQFRGGTVVLDVVAALGASGLPGSRLEVEITETVLLEDTEATISTLKQLRELGVSISMDDFGTGYSSLGYLRKFPFDKIKIDKSFIHDLSEQSDSTAIVRAVTGLGGSLGMAITAEGVETQEQLQRLKDEGCTEVQGYLISSPQPASELGALFERLRSGPKAAA
jgi:diguanylate cyclase (GGDEF)-like protein